MKKKDQFANDCLYYLILTCKYKNGLKEDKKIAEELGISTRMINNYKRWLEKNGFVKRTKRGRGYYKKHANWQYTEKAYQFFRNIASFLMITILEGEGFHGLREMGDRV